MNKRQTSLWLPVDVLRVAKLAAFGQKISMAQYIESLIREDAKSRTVVV